MITQGGQYQMVLNIFGNNKPKKRTLKVGSTNTLSRISSGEEIYIYQVAEHVHVMFPIKFMPKVFATF